MFFRRYGEVIEQFQENLEKPFENIRISPIIGNLLLRDRLHMSDAEIETMNKFDRLLAIQYCWITFNLMRPDLSMEHAKDETVKVKSDRVQELQEYEKGFVSKVKRYK